MRARAFDVIYNLSVHAELLYPSQTNAIEIDTQASAHPTHSALAWPPLTFVLCQFCFYLLSKVCRVP